MIYTFIITALSALILGGLSAVLKESHATNEAIFNKRAILAAVMEPSELAKLSDQQVLEIFEKQMEQKVLNVKGEVVEGKAENVDLAQEKKKPEADRLLPLYIFDNKGEKNYIISVRGSGLWDEIWGNFALKSDFNTISGASFDHKGETPGLGAEIKDNPKFPAQFKGEQLYNEKGEFVSIKVVKSGSNPEDKHAVDGISGATITSNGVQAMIEKGIKKYEPFLQEAKKGATINK